MKVDFDEDTKIGLVIRVRQDNRIEVVAQLPGSCNAEDVRKVVIDLLNSIVAQQIYECDIGLMSQSSASKH